MSHTSPATFLVWAIVSSLLGMFLIFHLWSFDRFKCLKWNNGPYSGAFKRVMTYSYLLSVPLIMTYSIGFAIIKYTEGFIFVPSMGIIPSPHQNWGPLPQAAILPLMLMFSVGWSLEMVTHLEELCFWLFLVNAASAQQDWFRSLYFKTWVFGSGVAVCYMPLVTIFTRSDPLKNEAYTFLAGSLGSLSLTIWFTPILWAFPAFLDNLRRENVDTATIVRLTKFHELNTLRVLFRFLFVCPLLILGVDGIRPHQHINDSMVSTDLLAMIAAFGCVVSSALTLVIFFPRSIEGEIAARDAARERRQTKSSESRTARLLNSRQSNHSQNFSMTQIDVGHPVGGRTYLLTSSPVKATHSLPDERSPMNSPYSQKYGLEDEEFDGTDMKLNLSAMPKLQPVRPTPSRRKGSDVEMGNIGLGLGTTRNASPSLTESNLSRHNMRMSKLNPMVHTFTSPIDLAYGSHQTSQQTIPGVVNDSRFTFARN